MNKLISFRLHASSHVNLLMEDLYRSKMLPKAAPAPLVAPAAMQWPRAMVSMEWMVSPVLTQSIAA